jgi:hypothetical protein
MLEFQAPIVLALHSMPQLALQCAALGPVRGKLELSVSYPLCLHMWVLLSQCFLSWRQSAMVFKFGYILVANLDMSLL